MHCSRRRLLRRGLEFHVCTINKSAPVRKTSGNLSYAPRINPRVSVKTAYSTEFRTTIGSLCGLSFFRDLHILPRCCPIVRTKMHYTTRSHYLLTRDATCDGKCSWCGLHRKRQEITLKNDHSPPVATKTLGNVILFVNEGKSEIVHVYHSDIHNQKDGEDQKKRKILWSMLCNSSDNVTRCVMSNPVFAIWCFWKICICSSKVPLTERLRLYDATCVSLTMHNCSSCAANYVINFILNRILIFCHTSWTIYVVCYRNLTYVIFCRALSMLNVIGTFSMLYIIGTLLYICYRDLIYLIYYWDHTIYMLQGSYTCYVLWRPYYIYMLQEPYLCYILQGPYSTMGQFLSLPCFFCRWSRCVALVPPFLFMFPIIWPVGWACWIHLLHLCRVVSPSATSVLIWR